MLIDTYSHLYVAKLERRARSRTPRARRCWHYRSGARSLPRTATSSARATGPIIAAMSRPALSAVDKILRNGGRQIVSFHIPGDMIDLPSALVMVADHSIRTHAQTSILSISHGDVLRIVAEHPDVGRAFWFDTLVDAAIFREWTVNVGRRNTRERTAHLLLEFAYRYKAIGALDKDEFELPVTQLDLSDALGMTAVHLNRTLQWLRKEGYIRMHSGTMSIENWPEMIRLAGFTPDYLHPEGPRGATIGPRDRAAPENRQIA